MFRALIFVALAGYASSTSRVALVSVTVNPDAAACLVPEALIPVPSGTSNETLLSTIDGWVTSMCSTKPCSNDTIAAVVKNITTSCASDAIISSAVLENIHNAQYVYPTVRKIMCSKDAGTNCVTSTLANIQTFMGSASRTIANLSDSNFGTLIATAGSFIDQLESNVKTTRRRRSIRFGIRSANETQTVQTTAEPSWVQIIQNDLPGSVDSTFPRLTEMCNINTTRTSAANETKAAVTGVLDNSATGLGAMLSALAMIVIAVSLETDATRYRWDPIARTCLQPAQLLPIMIGAGNGPESAIGYLDTWLGNMCSAPACSDDTLTAVLSSLTTGCSDEFGLSSSRVQQTIATVKAGYKTVRKVACLNERDSSSSGGINCVTGTLRNIEMLIGTMNLNATNILSIANLVKKGFPSSVVCTSCMKGAFTLMNQTMPGSFSASDIEYATDLCGPSFVGE
ncbi:hypothetical protein C0995_008200 [Termitomyces sp. Mi166|nr:hypothetical protein C0995_008200 [Termitomyces sp. Mi166\